MSKLFSNDELQLPQRLADLSYLCRKYSKAFERFKMMGRRSTGRLNGEVHRYSELVMREERKRYLGYE